MARQIALLDVREILRKKEEPFALIMQSVQDLGEQDTLELHATFDPVPLERVLGKQGFKNVVMKESDEHFIIQFYRDDAVVPYWHIDNRGLEPPQPMVRSLELLEAHPEFAQGMWGLEIWNERVPAVLLPELEDRGYQFDIRDEGEETVVVKIHR